MERDTRREMARERRADRHADADAHGETRPWKQRGREHVPETRSTPETAPAHLQATGAGARPLHPLRVALILPGGPASMGRGMGGGALPPESLGSHKGDAGKRLF